MTTCKVNPLFFFKGDRMKNYEIAFKCLLEGNQSPTLEIAEIMDSFQKILHESSFKIVNS